MDRFCSIAAYDPVCGAGSGVLVGDRDMAVRSPSAKRSCMVSACSIFLFLVVIFSLCVDAIVVGGVICRAERSLPRSRRILVVVCSVASRLSSDH